MNARYMLAVLACPLPFAAAPAAAQNAQTFVQSTGADGNPCTRDQPCRTFAVALGKTNDGGEIICANSGSYGNISIAKSVTIDCSAGPGYIFAPAGTAGVVMDTSGITVVLRGLHISGGDKSSTGYRGIRFFKGDSLTVEDSVISNFRGNGASPGFGISMQATVGARLVVKNTVIRDNSTGGGILIESINAGYVNATFDDVQITSNGGIGISLDSTSASGSSSNVSANGLIISGSTTGVLVAGPAGTPGGTVNIIKSLVSGNLSSGLRADGPNARIIVAQSTISGNTTGISSNSGGLVGSGTGNNLFGNGVNGTFAGLISPQ